MLSKNKVRFIISLQRKKIRDEHKLFIIEGDKLVKEFLNAGMPVMTLVAKPEFLDSLPAQVTSVIKEIEPVSYEELKRISTLKTPHNAMAVVSMQERKFDPKRVFKELCVALDFIQDPGNLGTIIRAAAWFGIKNIICSEGCVDVYNPKVIPNGNIACSSCNIQNIKTISVSRNNLYCFSSPVEKWWLKREKMVQKIIAPGYRIKHRFNIYTLLRLYFHPFRFKIRVQR